MKGHIWDIRRSTTPGQIHLDRLWAVSNVNLRCREDAQQEERTKRATPKAPQGEGGNPETNEIIDLDRTQHARGERDQKR